MSLINVFNKKNKEHKIDINRLKKEIVEGIEQKRSVSEMAKESRGIIDDRVGSRPIISPDTTLSLNPTEWKVKQCDSGFIVEIGCKVLVFETEKALFDAQKLYIKDPEKAKEKYLK